jgi:hypothetical protein
MQQALPYPASAWMDACKIRCAPSLYIDHGDVKVEVHGCLRRRALHPLERRRRRRGGHREPQRAAHADPAPPEADRGLELPGDDELHLEDPGGALPSERGHLVGPERPGVLALPGLEVDQDLVPHLADRLPLRAVHPGAGERPAEEAELGVERRGAGDAACLLVYPQSDHECQVVGEGRRRAVVARRAGEGQARQGGLVDAGPEGDGAAVHHRDGDRTYEPDHGKDDAAAGQQKKKEREGVRCVSSGRWVISYQWHIA